MRWRLDCGDLWRAVRRTPFNLDGGAVSHNYRSLRERAFDGCRVEVTGSAGFHRLHWEALRDPGLDVPLGACQAGRQLARSRAGSVALLLDELLDGVALDRVVGGHRAGDR